MAECNQFRNDIPQAHRIGIVLDAVDEAQDFLALRFSKHLGSPERRFLQIGQILKRVYRMNQYHEIRREKVLGSCYNHAVLHGASPEAQGPSSSHGGPLNFACNLSQDVYRLNSVFCGSGVAETFLADGRHTDPRDYRRLNDFSSTIYEPEFLGRTYVCTQRKLTADRGTQSGKKGPLLDVNPERSGEGIQGWRNPGNGQLLDAAINAYVPVDRRVSRTCIPRTLCRREQGLNLLGWRVSK